MTARLQNRRDTAANWTSNNPTLAAGEIGYETDTAKLKIGDGTTAWTSLSYAVGTVPVGNVTGLGTGVATFLATPSSTNLISAVTDETGSGSLVFGTSPTLTTPIVSTSASFNNEAEIRFLEATANGSNYVGFKAPSTLSANKIWTLPTADGSANQVLTTDGSGNLSFAAASSGVSANDQAFAFAVQVFA